MMALVLGWVKTTVIAVAAVAKIVIPVLATVYINYELSKRIPYNGAEEEKFIANIILAVVFSIAQIMFMCAIRSLVQQEEIQAAKSYIKSTYDSVKKAYIESKVKLEKDMHEFDVEAQTLINKDN
jgi:lysylphosphatidylglycerol synthetase-like protein (DUF2156 family)